MGIEVDVELWVGFVVALVLAAIGVSLVVAMRSVRNTRPVAGSSRLTVFLDILGWTLCLLNVGILGLLTVAANHEIANNGAADFVIPLTVAGGILSLVVG